MPEFPTDPNFINKLTENELAPKAEDLEQTLAKIRIELEPIFSENHHTFTHFTLSDKEAESIMRTGLGFPMPAMTYSMSLIYDHPKSLKRFLRPSSVRSGSAEAAVILMFPKSQMELAQGIGSAKDNGESFFTKVTPDDSLNSVTTGSTLRDKFRWKIDPKYIRGYWDIKTKHLVLNDKFEENPAPPRPQDQLG